MVLYDNTVLHTMFTPLQNWQCKFLFACLLKRAVVIFVHLYFFLFVCVCKQSPLNFLTDKYKLERRETNLDFREYNSLY